MSELYPSDAALNALSGTSDPEQEVLYLPIGEAPYYTSFYRMQRRLLDVARRAGDLRVYKSGDLTFGVRPGRFSDGGGPVVFAGAASQALTNNSVNYIYLSAAGQVLANTTGFPPASVTPHIRLATIATGSASANGVSGAYDFADIVDVRGEALWRVQTGWTSALAAEAAGFFSATDLTGAEAETLSGGGPADALHRHEAAGVSNLLGTLFAAPAVQALAADGFTLAHGNRRAIHITCSGLFSSSAAAAIADGAVVGQRLTVFRTANGPTLTIRNGANTKLNGDWKRDCFGSALELCWDGSDWCELWRSDFENTRNVASGDSAKAEGSCSTASGYAAHAQNNATTASGDGSHAEGTGSVACGNSAHAQGAFCVASGDFSTAVGKQSVAGLFGQVAHANGCFDNAGDSQHTRTILRGETDGATPTELTLTGGSPTEETRLSLLDGRTCAMRVLVAARKADGQSAMFHRQFVLRRVGSTVDLVGSVQTIGVDINPAAWGLTVQANNVNKGLQVLVTGSAGNYVRWMAAVESLEIVNE